MSRPNDNPPHRIAVVLPHSERFSEGEAGAIALCVQDMARASRYRRHIRVLGTPVDRPLDGAAFVPVAATGTWWRPRTWAYAAAVRRLLEPDPPALVEVHNRPQVFRHLARQAPGLRLTLHFHNDPLGMDASRSAQSRRAILDRAAAVYCVSDFVRGRFLAGLDGDRGKVHVLHNGIAWPQGPAPAKENLILFVGRLTEDKGVHVFAEAVAGLLPRHPAWRAILVGGHLPSGRESGSAYARAVHARFTAIGAAVEFRGFMSHGDVMALFRRAAIAVVPSQWEEPFSRTVIEGLASGCAVIASARGGIPEPMGDAGILLPFPTAPALAEAIEGLIRDPERRRSLQRRARARRGFEIETVAARQDALREAIAPELAAVSAVASRSVP